MEARLDLFEDAQDTADPVDKLILTRIRQPILGCGTAILIQFQRGEEEPLCLGYCSPDELRFAMSGVGVLSLPERRVRTGLQPYGR